MRLAKTFAIAFAIPTPLAAQAPDSLTLQGRNLLTLGVGLVGSRDVSVGSGGTTAQSTGQLASIGYTHFVWHSVALEAQGAVLDASASSGAGNEAGAVTALLFGMRVAPRMLAITPSIRAFEALAVGPYYHSVAQASRGSAYSSSQTRLGARVGLGVNAFLSRHFLLQLEGYYHAVGEFAAVNNVTRNPSGLGFSAGFGFAWGKH